MIDNVEYGFQVIRGWPADGALDNADYQIDETAVKEDTFTAGDVVTLNASGKLVKAGDTATNLVGFIVRGPHDSLSVQAVNNRPTVIWGNFIARTTKFNTDSTFAPGTPITALNGVVDVAGVDAPVLGHVLEVSTGNADAGYLVIVVK